MAEKQSNPSPTFRQMEDRVDAIAKDQAATDRALDTILQKQSDLDDKMDRLLRKLRGQIDLREMDA